jgi:thioredoxin-related protein
MRRTLFSTLCALAVGSFFYVSPANALGGPAWRSWDAGLREAGTSGRPVLVDVTTDWCGWCKRMDRDVYARADVRDYLARKFVTVKLDAESGDAARYEGRAHTSRTLAARFGVTGYPTTVFLSAKGALLGSVPGYLSPEDFLLLLRFIGDGHAARGESLGDFQRAAGAGAGRPPR